VVAQEQATCGHVGGTWAIGIDDTWRLTRCKFCEFPTGAPAMVSFESCVSSFYLM
jgi:hypothetical protein